VLQEEDETWQECARLLQREQRRLMLLQGRFVYDAQQEAEQRQHKLTFRQTTTGTGAVLFQAAPALIISPSNRNRTERQFYASRYFKATVVRSFVIFSAAGWIVIRD